MKELKKVLGNNAFWTINKELANDIGLDATVLLQHFIDLQYTYFEDGGFYQQQHRLINSLPLTLDYLRNATKLLINKKFITVVKKGIPARNHYTVHEGNVLSYLSDTTSRIPEAPLEVSQKDDKRGLRDTTYNKNKNSKNKDNKNKNNNVDKRILDTLIKVYPKHRVNSHAPILKYLSKCTDEQKKLIVTNVKRYLEVVGDYTKNLRNYLEHECYTEEWLSANENLNKSKNLNKNNVTNAKSFTDKNRGFYD